MKLLFPAFCWAVITGGVLGACSKKPKSDVIYLPEFTKEIAKEEKAMPDPNEKILDLDAPNWTIYFGFDSFALREGYKAAALGKWLMENGGTVSLSGFASEEGTEAYNLALGAKRAQTVRDYLGGTSASPFLDPKFWQAVVVSGARMLRDLGQFTATRAQWGAAMVRRVEPPAGCQSARMPTASTWPVTLTLG